MYSSMERDGAARQRSGVFERLGLRNYINPHLELHFGRVVQLHQK